MVWGPLACVSALLDSNTIFLDMSRSGMRVVTCVRGRCAGLGEGGWVSVGSKRVRCVWSESEGAGSGSVAGEAGTGGGR